MSGSKIFRKSLKVLLVVFIIIGIMVLVFPVLNLPVSKRLITNKVNGIFEKSELPLHIQAIHRILPRQVNVEGFVIHGAENDSLVYAGEIRATFKPKEILRSRVVLNTLQINKVIVDFSRTDQDRDLNIAEAFSQGGKTTEKVPQEKKPSWEIVANKADFNDILFQMKDIPSGISIAQEIGTLSLDRFILSLEDHAITAGSLELIRSEGGFSKMPATKIPEENTGEPWSFEIGKAGMKNIDFTYNDKVDSLLLEVLLKEGEIRTRQTDLAGKRIDIEKIKLKGTEASIYSGSRSTVKDTVQKNHRDTKGPVFTWNIEGSSIELTDNYVKLGYYPSNNTEPDTSILEISGLTLDLAGLNLSPDKMKANLKKLQFKLDNGFRLDDLRAGLDSDEKLTSLDLSIQTGNSKLGLIAEADGFLLQLLQDPAHLNGGSIKLDHTEISPEDLALFLNEPGGNPLLKVVSDEMIELEGDLDIRNSLLQIDRISLSQEKRFVFRLSGTASQPFTPEKLTGDLEFGLQVKDGEWLTNALTGLGVGDSLTQTGALSLQGLFSGNYFSPEVAVDIQSDLGRIGVEGNVDIQQKTYDLQTSLEDMMIGRLFAVHELGSVTGRGRLTGSGMNQETLDAGLEFKLDTLFFKEYPYTGTALHGSIHHGNYGIEIKFDDPSITGYLEGHMAHEADTGLTVNSSGYLKANLYDLHFYKDTLTVETQLNASFVKSGNTMGADVWLTGLGFEDPWDQVVVDSVEVSFRTDTLESNLTLYSDFMELTADLGFSIDSLGTLGHSYQNYLFSMADTIQDSGSVRINYLPEMNVQGSVVYSDLFPLFIGDSTLLFSDIEVSLTNDASHQWIDYRLTGNNFYSNGISVGNLSVHLSDSSGFLDIEAVALNNRIMDTPASQITLNSRISDYYGQTDVSIIDRRGSRLFHFDLASRINDSLMQISSPSKEMILNGNPWQMDEPEILAVNLNSGEMYPSLEIHRDSSIIGLHSDRQNDQTRYYIGLSDLKIESVLPAGLVSGDPSGSVTGELKYDMEKSLARQLYAEMHMDSIRWSGLRFDRIDVNAGLDAKENGDLDLNVIAQMDSAEVTLSRALRDSTRQDIEVKIKSLPINTFQPFVKKYLSGMKGLVSGEFILNETLNQRDVRGELNILDAQVNVVPFNASFRIPEDRISFNGRRLVLSDFTVLDSLGNNLILDGYVDVRNEGPISTNLQVTASKLQVMNKEDDGNASFYGNVIIDSRMSMKGPLNNPVIKGNVTLAEGSDIYYRHKEDLSLSETEKIITFVNHSFGEEHHRPMNASSFTPLQQKSIETSVVIDPATGIHFSIAQQIYNIDLEIRGGGSLEYQMKGNNQNSLTGSYEIREGTAEVKMVGWPAKNFRLTRGGYVRWDGLMDNPEVELEAVNSVRSTYTNPVDGNYREIDFNVVLQLSNRLSELEVQFLLNTTDQYMMSVINTLSPEEQLRQAISVLLFERVDLPGISTTSNYMSEQVNQLVASQLNQLTKTSIQGIDISLGIDSYKRSTEGGGEEMTTSLSYDVRKEFLDERANIEISGRLNDLYNQPGASDFTLNNISFEYRLDSAGTKFIKVYNEHAYEDVFEGEVISTGFGITFRKKYSSLGEIWRKDPEGKKSNKEQ